MTPRVGMRAALLAALVLPGLCLTAAAQDAGAGAGAGAGSGLTVGGEFKLEYLDARGDDETVLDADLGLSWRSGGLLGFDAALSSTALLDSDQDRTNLWAALVLSTAAGDLSLGAPRPVTETMAVMPRFSSSRLLNLETATATGPLVTFVNLGLGDTLVPGIAWAGRSGNLSYGYSFHRLDSGTADYDFHEAMMVYSMGRTTLFLSGERGTAAGNDVTVLGIGGLLRSDRYALGVELTQSDFSGSPLIAGRLHGSYDIVPSVTVTGDLLAREDDDDIYSVSAQYRFGAMGYVEGGVAIIDDTRTYDIGIGLKF